MGDFPFFFYLAISLDTIIFSVGKKLAVYIQIKVSIVMYIYVNSSSMFRPSPLPLPVFDVSSLEWIYKVVKSTAFNSWIY